MSNLISNFIKKIEFEPNFKVVELEFEPEPCDIDRYFQLNPMIKTDAIKLATLHLDGEAHEWWYHGLVTLGHNTITSYLDFTQRLIERFDRKDPKVHFRELAQLKQTGSAYAFISDF